MTAMTSLSRCECTRGGLASTGAPTLHPQHRGAGGVCGPRCSFPPPSSALFQGGFPFIPPSPNPFPGLRPMRHTIRVIRSRSSQPVHCLREVPDLGRPYACQILPSLQAKGQLLAHFLWELFPAHTAFPSSTLSVPPPPPTLALRSILVGLGWGDKEALLSCISTYHQEGAQGSKCLCQPWWGELEKEQTLDANFLSLAGFAGRLSRALACFISPACYRAEGEIVQVLPVRNSR